MKNNIEKFFNEITDEQLLELRNGDLILTNRVSTESFDIKSDIYDLKNGSAPQSHDDVDNMDLTIRFNNTSGAAIGGYISFEIYNDNINLDFWNITDKDESHNFCLDFNFFKEFTDEEYFQFSLVEEISTYLSLENIKRLHKLASTLKYNEEYS